MNSNAFQDHEFAAPMVKNQPLPVAESNVEKDTAGTSNSAEASENTENQTPRTPTKQALKADNTVTAWEILPLLKAGPFKTFTQTKDEIDNSNWYNW